MAIYDHSQAQSAKTFMNIYGSFMIIFDQRKKSFMAIFDHSQARSAKTFMGIYGSFMIIFDQRKSHSWQFMTIPKRGAQKHS